MDTAPTIPLTSHLYLPSPPPLPPPCPPSAPATDYRVPRARSRATSHAVFPLDHRTGIRVPWEREALALLRELLPDAEPFRAWSNFEFIADDGSINEVDLLVVSLHRIYLVEIKSPPGRVEGDGGPGGGRRDSRRAAPTTRLLLANRKAKKLKSLLGRQQAMKRLRMPYVEAAVFLSHKDVQCALTGAARTGVYLREGAAGDGEPHVGELLTGARETARGHAPDRIDPRSPGRRGSSPCCGMGGTRGWWWCWTRWRRCSGGILPHFRPWRNLRLLSPPCGAGTGG